jgi:hypothetical protein
VGAPTINIRIGNVVQSIQKLLFARMILPIIAQKAEWGADKSPRDACQSFTSTTTTTAPPPQRQKSKKVI